MKKTSLIFSILVTLILPLVTYAAVGTFKDFANVLVTVDEFCQYMGLQSETVAKQLR